MLLYRCLINNYVVVIAVEGKKCAMELQRNSEEEQKTTSLIS
jgi:hypothetical protein